MLKKKWYLLICLVRSAGDLTWWGRANPDRSESPYLSSNLRISFESIFRNGLMRLSWKITPLAQVAIVWPQEVGKQRAPLRTYRDVLVSSFCPRGLYRKLWKSIFGKSRDSGDSVYMLSNQETPCQNLSFIFKTKSTISSRRLVWYVKCFDSLATAYSSGISLARIQLVQLAAWLPPCQSIATRVILMPM